MKASPKTGTSRTVKKSRFPIREGRLFCIVIEWIIKNQFGRRNLSLYDRTKLALRLEGIYRERAKEKEAIRKSTCINSDKSDLTTVDTLKEISKAAGVGRDTVAHVKVIEAKATPEQKADLSAGNFRGD